jgi:hypothetical protein
LWFVYTEHPLGAGPMLGAGCHYKLGHNFCSLGRKMTYEVLRASREKLRLWDTGAMSPGLDGKR